MPTPKHLVLIAALVFLAGCGSDSPSSSALPARLLTSVAVSTTLPLPRASYTLTRSGAGAWSANLVSDNSAVALPAGVTRIRFADMTVNLTVADTVKAMPAADLQAIVELYIAYFNRIPDADGLEYWAQQKQGGRTLEQIGDAFYGAAVQYTDLTGYKASMTNSEFVTKTYRNALGRTPDDAGLKYWTGQLDAGQATRGSLVRSMLAAAHTFKGDATYGWVADMLDNKLSLGLSFAVTQGLNFNSSEDSIASTMALAAGLTPGAGYWSVQGAGAGVGGTQALTTLSFDSARQAALQRQPDSLTGMTYDVGSGVSAAQLDQLKQGFSIAQAFLDSKLGGGVPAVNLRYVTAKIIASGKGNEESGGGGSCCTGLADSQTNFVSITRATASSAPQTTTSTMHMSAMRPFFDVLHPSWLQQSDPNIRLKVAAHEYTHGWQSSIGCISLYSQPLGQWLNEGIAEYLGYEAMIQRGAWTREQALAMQLDFAKGSGQLTVPLRDLAATSAPYWPGNAGYLALDMLLKTAPNGLKALRTICEESAKGASTAAAFQTAFGISMDNFYLQFEAARKGWNGQ